MCFAAGPFGVGAWSLARLHDNLTQDRGRRGLDEEHVETSVVRPLTIQFPAVAGQGYEQRLVEAIHLPQPAGDLVAVHARHAEVEQHHVRPEIVRDLQRGGAVIGHQDPTGDTARRDRTHRGCPPYREESKKRSNSPLTTW